MAPVTHTYDPPERFVAGTVGEPGARTFFLQARAGTRITSVALEKQQVEILGQRVDELLDEVISSSGDDTEAVVPAVTPHELLDDAPLEQPIDEEFRVGTMTLSWEPADARVVLEIFSVAETQVTVLEESEDGTEAEVEVEEGEPGELLLVRLSAGQARAFASRAEKVVSAGRAQCPFCSEPMDPNGHLCVRANGFRRSGGR
ncbi:DUF3090 family protein [Nocardioidaceae bacterium]|nr:DUF3090 family protein [Nocardioidaceae bacterium]